MHKHIFDKHRSTMEMFLLTGAFVLALFYLESHQGFNLLDEGFLWYGAQRVMAGEVPLRDFMAYDIGRYYWSAAIMSLQGDNGIVSLRGATALFQAIALFFGLNVLVRNSPKQNLFFWSLAAITLALWMAPQFRLFDISLPIILIGALSYLAEQPSSRRYFMTGLVVGLMAVFGRNHGLYGVAGSLGVMIYLCIRGSGLRAAFMPWLAGVAAGYLPVLMFFVFVPGFMQAFWESMQLVFETRATNFALPVPWPWLVPFGKISFIDSARGVLVGILFIAIVVFGVLGIILVIRARLQSRPVSPVLVAAVFLALPYAHYAYSRADIAHLAPGIPPFLIGALVMLASRPDKIKWPFAGLLCGASFLVMLPMHAGWNCYASQKCVTTAVAGDRLNVDPMTASYLVVLNQLAGQFAPGDRAFIAAPFVPGAYAALGRKSPMWEVYALFPRSTAFQQAEIERIKKANPGLVVIHDFALDGRDELRFKNTHPVIDQYLREHFEHLEGIIKNPAYQVYKSR